MIKKLKKTIKGIYLHTKYGKSISFSDKVIIITLVENKFNRYLYPLFYMLHSNGYKPVLNLKKSELTHMYYDVYQRLIFKNGLYFKHSKNMSVVKNIVLDPDYFSALFKNDSRDSIIPMCMHPSIYDKNIKPHKNDKTNRIVFFAGTISEIHHNKTQVFKDVISRYEMAKFLKKLKNTIFVSNKNKVENLYNTSSKTHFLIYDINTLNLSPNNLFKELSRSSFFLGLPGRGMPLSHNIIEAMCCNCIPILQDIYANMFPVPLENNINCLIYKSKTDLINISSIIDSFDIEEINTMKVNVKTYYEKYLSPKAITKLVTNTENQHFYVQAEGRSIILYKQNVKKTFNIF